MLMIYQHLPFLTYVLFCFSYDHGFQCIEYENCKRIILSDFIFKHISEKLPDNHEYKIICKRKELMEFLENSHVVYNVGYNEDMKNAYIEYIECVPDINLDIDDDGNKISSNIMNIPKYIIFLEKLSVLKITNTKISSIPAVLSVLSNLKYLSIKNNNFIDMPDAIFIIESLNYLKIQENKIDTFIIPIYNQIKYLKMLSIVRTPLKVLQFTYDPNPISLKIEKLKLKLNGLGKLNQKYFLEIFYNIGSLNNLEILIITFNNLKKVPESILRIETLKKLDLSHNEIIYFPQFLYFSKKIQSLDLSCNLIENINSKLTKYNYQDGKNIFYKFKSGECIQCNNINNIRFCFSPLLKISKCIFE
ncbi:Leucine rich repeat protein [Spraguea lophii 42_110]|uniref:Leucine rich repeat protein n=1 Tax=Spraguea lophii (strain 42_110) TaxID=1358809 RepID=S7W8A7_SPRLO|nr:Leucine rich repeat protein [Spraguea lophii 42_110]